jgi:hypothetical protein
MCATCAEREEFNRMQKTQREMMSCLCTYTIHYPSFLLLQEHMKDGCYILLSPYRMNFEAVLS